MKKFLALLIALLLLALPALAEVFVQPEVLVDGEFAMTEDWTVEYGWDYYSPEEVSLYLHVFCELPPNYLTKEEARDLGWDSRAGNLWEVAEGMCIGGDTFGNREGILPDEEGRDWYECDVNYEGGHRNAERLVFSSDGLIYYTEDHYETFDLLYDGWYEGEVLVEGEWGYNYNSDEEENDLLGAILDAFF